jgi:hypothetical protein
MHATPKLPIRCACVMPADAERVRALVGDRLTVASNYNEALAAVPAPLRFCDQALQDAGVEHLLVDDLIMAMADRLQAPAAA